MGSLVKWLSRSRRALILICITINVSVLIVHSICANMYYRSNRILMQMVAVTAVRAGALYLPGSPRTAVQVADAYVKLNGVMPSEIVSTVVAANDNTLTIVLKRELPTYMTLLVMGLPGREINVTAQAKKWSEHLQARTQTGTVTRIAPGRDPSFRAPLTLATSSLKYTS
jgi:hypothetical protein